MASRKTNFTIPVDLSERSRYVSDAIAAKLREREEQMIRACEVANNDADVLAIERDWEALVDKADLIEEPWNNAPPR